MKPADENPIKHSSVVKSTNSFELGGGLSRRCVKTTVGKCSVDHMITPRLGEDMVRQNYDIRTNYNVGELTTLRIDNSKLIISLHVDRTKYESHDELYPAIREWWVNVKGRANTTVTDRIRYARSMQNHTVFPVDWLKFEPEQILNQLLYRQNFEYKELAEKTGNPHYGATQLTNLWKTVNMFAEAYGIDISFWGWNPPTPPEPQVKIVPRPVIVNRLIHQ